ncbi:MAG: hypothetical protein ACJA01_003177 [Saprospiraceae bacterium]|jgi:hypothetical protein
MQRKYRDLYNRLLTPDKYDQINQEVAERCGITPTFRIGETPVFLEPELWDQLLTASRQLLDYIGNPAFKGITEGAMLPGTKVPNETPHPHMVAMDFGICETADGSIVPKLIEMQGFPTVSAFQYQLLKSYQSAIPEIAHLSPFMEVSEEEYISMLRSILGKKNTILMDVKPERQNTYVDFKATELMFGVPSVCVSDIQKSGQDLYYKDADGKLKDIDYIFNRVIFDELLQRTDLKLNFSFFEELNMNWISHPNWYFRISKYTMPYMDFDFVPRSSYISDLKEIPNDLENFILKPLYSFSGQGVQMDITEEDILAVDKKAEWLLQEKVHYAPIIEAPDGKVKFEVRVVALWPDELEKPVIVFNIVRMTKGAMVGVKYNKDKAWVGSSVALLVP